MQNSSPEQMKMLLTRIGEDSKMVVLGDVNQNTHTANGLKDLITKIRKYYDVETFYYDMNSDGISLVSLNEKDVQRSEIVKKVLHIYK
jgi:phosphate starvation-inducible PhoH-like protein